MATANTVDYRKAIEHELKVIPTTSVQSKLLASLRGQSLDNVIQTLKEVLGVVDFNVNLIQAKSLFDEYFDTDDLALYSTRSVFCTHRDVGPPCLVIKRLVEQDRGELIRAAQESDLTEETYQHLLTEGFLSVVTKEFPDLRNKKLDYKLTISIERRDFLLERQDERYQLSLDIFFYSDPKTGRTSNRQFEVQLKVLSDAASAKLKAIKHILLDVRHDFEYSKGSKYDRGVRLSAIDKAE